MREQEHNYELYREYRAIKFVPKDEKRPIVKAELDKNGFWTILGGLSVDENSLEIVENEEYYYPEDYKLPMFSVYRLINDVVDALYKSWNPPEKYSLDDINDKLETERYVWNLDIEDQKRIAKQTHVNVWTRIVTKKTLSKVFSRLWNEIMENDFDETIVEIHKKCFSVSCGSGAFDNIEVILRNRDKLPYLIKDLLKYRAARISILHSSIYWKTRNDIHPYTRFMDINWRQAYLPNNEESYTSLNRTLMNLPGGVTYHLFFNLRNFTLEEPVKTRLKMYSYLTLHDPGYPHGHIDEKEKVIMRSSEETIEEALRYMFHYFPTGNKFDLRRTKKIISLFHTIYDYPGEVGEWDMLGLAKRSEQYHHETQTQREERLRKQRELNKKVSFCKTALPPIPLPKDNNIKFLDSYNDVEDEGELMKHCIAGYANGAVMGEYYLFHIDYNGEMASAQVTLKGYVTQIYGPKDCKNVACDYGGKVLREWGKKLVDAGSPVKRIISNEEFEKFKSEEKYEEVRETELNFFENEVTVALDNELPERRDMAEFEMEIPF